jgi:hypothetical protein
LEPSIETAERLLNEGERMNPGPWVQHSRYVASAARLISNELPDLDGNTAYVLGLLHDIGRREGVSDMHHILDGYRFLEAQGYSDAARICLTHSYPIPVARSFSGVWDVTPEELQFVQDYLDGIEYTPSDHLIQLCDALALPTGFCLVEKRLMDVALRRGVNEYSVTRWKAYLQIQRDFEAQLGRSIYSLLPGCVENTFKELSW